MRISPLKVLTLFIFLTLFVRTVYYQVLKHQELYEESLRNYIKTLRLEPVRGVILDRYGTPIASYKPQFRVSIVPEKIDPEEWASLTKTLNWRVELDSLYGLDLLTVKRGLTIEQVTYLEEHADQLPWLFVSSTTTRYYPYDGLFFHSIGYIGRVDPQDLNNGYQPDDFIGKTGIERAYENILRGKNGFRYLAFDAKGRITKLDPVPPVPPKSGTDIKTTLDLNLQAYTDTLLKDFPVASVVMLQPRTGDILVLYSKPYINPNLIVSGIPSKLWRNMVEDTTKPLLNRALRGLYAPGSTLKPLVGAVALDLNLIKPSEKLRPCTGKFTFGDRTWNCWLESGHGKLNFYDAVAYSCDVYFYQVGLRIGLSRFLRIFNNLRLTRVWLPPFSNKKGFFPTMSWYVKTYGRYGFSEGSVLNLAIGQGEILMTPLDLAVMVGLIALSPASLKLPHLLAEEDKGSVSLPFGGKTMSVVRKSMLYVVEYGTGKLAKVNGIKVAGKTGTSQNPHGRDHSLFIGFAPYENPEVAIAVVIENVGHGGKFAAPIAGRLLKKYFELKGVSR